MRLDDPGATPLVLTGGAVAIWLALEVPQSAASLVESVAASAGMDPDVIAGDVEAFVADAVGSGLLVAPEIDPEFSSPQPADS